MTRRELLPQVEALLIDARDMCERIALSRPGSLPTAQLCVDDVVRAYSLIESARNKISNKRAREIMQGSFAQTCYRRRSMRKYSSDIGEIATEWLLELALVVAAILALASS